MPRNASKRTSTGVSTSGPSTAADPRALDLSTYLDPSANYRLPGETTPAELGILLEGGWRECRTSSRLIAVAGRTEFRSRIGELLLASGGPYGGAYCITLATFATSATPSGLHISCSMLASTRALLHRTFAFSALLHLDAVLGTERGSPGTGRSWTSSVPSPASALNSLPERKPGPEPPDLTAERPTASAPSVESGQ
ncbi:MULTISPECIES: DUF6000 family protein [Streptomyces]|uniref:DUF6000 family protein n=1 Tax=Streptomyces galilaeus TaxID=33899 RepID=A0ABW9IXL2_STRGJ